MEQCHFLSEVWHSLEISVHIEQGWHAVFQYNLEFSVEKYCFTRQTAYIAQKMQKIDLQG